MPEPPTMCRALVVDDDPLITALYSRLLSDMNFDVETADDGEQALRVIRRWLPDVVLLDLDMPRMDGLTLLKKIRGRRRSRSLPVVFLTEGGAGEQVRAARRSDATAVLSKARMHPSLVADMVAAAAAPGGVALWT